MLNEYKNRKDHGQACSRSWQKMAGVDKPTPGAGADKTTCWNAVV